MKDLRGEITVYFLTVGRPTANRAWESLMGQDSKFDIDVIKNVTPMAKAHQVPLDSCCTRYFTHVDEDMVLRPHAVRTAFERIEAMDEDVAMVVFPLWDRHLNHALYNFRTHRTSAVAGEQVGSTIDPDVVIYKRLLARGKKVVMVGNRGGLAGNVSREDPEVLGFHEGCYSDKATFRHYEKGIRSARLHGTSDFMFVLAGELTRRLCGDAEVRNNTDFWGLLGILQGLGVPKESLAQDRGTSEADGYPELAAHVLDDPEILDLYEVGGAWPTKAEVQQALDTFPSIQHVRPLKGDPDPEPDDSRGCLVPYTHLGLGPRGALTGCGRVSRPDLSTGNLAFGHDCWRASPGLRAIRRSLARGSSGVVCYHCLGKDE